MIWREFREQITPLLYGGEATMEELQEALILMYEHCKELDLMFFVCAVLAITLLVHKMIDILNSVKNNDKENIYVFDGEQGSGRKCYFQEDLEKLKEDK